MEGTKILNLLEVNKKLERAKYMESHPNHIPVIFVGENVKLTKDLYLFRKDVTMMVLMKILRRDLGVKLDPSSGLYLFVNKSIIGVGTTVGDLVRQYNDCGFLVIQVAIENTFG